MGKRLFFSMVLVIAAAGCCAAGDFNVGLTVSDRTLVGDVHYKEQMMNGYWRLGGAAVYAEKTNMDYKWLELDYFLGNDLLHPGLNVEAGLKGIYGDAQEEPYSGDIGSVAFSGKIGYLFPTTATFLPVEIFADITYGPQILSFRDNENYFAYGAGLSFKIVDRASIVAGYYVYDVKMESGPGEWTLYDNQFRFGLTLGF